MVSLPGELDVQSSKCKSLAPSAESADVMEYCDQLATSDADQQLAGHRSELPENFHFMDSGCREALEELPQFQAIRCAFGVDDSFTGAARSLLSKVVTEGERSTAKSGSIMAFDNSFMVKSMSSWEAWTLSAILKEYLKHIHMPENRSENGATPATLLPRFLGAYVHVGAVDPVGLVKTRSYYVIMANVFAEVPPEVLCGMERFDLKGSADDRQQRYKGSELMDFDLLRLDRKLIPDEPEGGAALLEQLSRDLGFLLEQRMPADGSVPEALRGSPGLMDYSLLIGLVPRDTPGGLSRLDVNDSRTRSSPRVPAENWRIEAEPKTALIGVIDVLQFWTPAKCIARTLKRAAGMELDEDWEYHGEMLDTLQPAPYKQRFHRFVQEVFVQGSWVDSLFRLNDGDWSKVLEKHISQLPFEQGKEAERRRQYQSCGRRLGRQHKTI